MLLLAFLLSLAIISKLKNNVQNSSARTVIEASNNVRSPEGVQASFEVQSLAGALVAPRHPEITRRRHANGRAVSPRHARQIFTPFRAPLRVKHSPFALRIVPYDRRISGAVVQRITPQWRRRSSDVELCTGC